MGRRRLDRADLIQFAHHLCSLAAYFADWVSLTGTDPPHCAQKSSGERYDGFDCRMAIIKDARISLWNFDNHHPLFRIVRHTPTNELRAATAGR